jgi:HK97 family phage prohead protease
VRDWKRGDRIQCDFSFDQTTEIQDGFIAGVASAPTTDLYGHKVLPHAFTHSIQKKGLSGPRGVKLLAHHDWTKPAGTIKRLETVGENLSIEAQMNLNVSYVKDLYEAAKQNGGLNFSVGFTLEDFEFVDEDQAKSGEDAWLVIKKGDLMEVSIVCFPACVEAEMSLVKSNPNSLTEFEKVLVADGLCKNRSDAQRITLAVKNSPHLFYDKAALEAASHQTPNRPWLDVSKLQAATDLAVKARAFLSSR